MKKFTNLKPTVESTPKSEPLYQDDFHAIVKYEDWSITTQKDGVFALIYLIEENKFILHHEYIPAFKFRDGQDYHLTLIGGGIEKGESPEKALFREIEEEAGIAIRPDFKLEILKPFFLNKGCTAKTYFSLVVLHNNDFDEITATGDGSKIEKISHSVKIDVKFIKQVNTSDLMTEYMILQLKEYLNLN